VAYVIAIASHKGGVGKTTTTVNLAAALSAMGRKILAVDLDPQGGLTVCTGIHPDSLEKTIYDALKRQKGGESIMLATKFGADLLPANVDLALIEIELVNAIARERRLAAVLNPLRDNYDFILIDCSPSLGLLTLNAMTVADGVIIPVACEYLAMRAVRGFVKFVRKVQGSANSKLEVIGILPTMFDKRTRHAQETYKELMNAFHPQIPVLPYIVYRSIRFAEAAEAAESILTYAKAAPGADAYRDLAKFMIERYCPEKE